MAWRTPRPPRARSSLSASTSRSCSVPDYASDGVQPGRRVREVEVPRGVVQQQVRVLVRLDGVAVEQHRRADGVVRQLAGTPELGLPLVAQQLLQDRPLLLPRPGRLVRRRSGPGPARWAGPGDEGPVAAGLGAAGRQESLLGAVVPPAQRTEVARARRPVRPGVVVLAVARRRGPAAAAPLAPRGPQPDQVDQPGRWAVGPGWVRAVGVVVGVARLVGPVVDRDGHAVPVHAGSAHRRTCRQDGGGLLAVERAVADELGGSAGREQHHDLRPARRPGTGQAAARRGPEPLGRAAADAPEQQVDDGVGPPLVGGPLVARSWCGEGGDAGQERPRLHGLDAADAEVDQPVLSAPVVDPALGQRPAPPSHRIGVRLQHPPAQPLTEPRRRPHGARVGVLHQQGLQPPPDGEPIGKLQHGERPDGRRRLLDRQQAAAECLQGPGQLGQRPGGAEEVAGTRLGAPQQERQVSHDEGVVDGQHRVGCQDRCEVEHLAELARVLRRPLRLRDLEGQLGGVQPAAPRLQLCSRAAAHDQDSRGDLRQNTTTRCAVNELVSASACRS